METNTMEICFEESQSESDDLSELSNSSRKRKRDGKDSGNSKDNELIIVPPLKKQRFSFTETSSFLSSIDHTAKNSPKQKNKSLRRSPRFQAQQNIINIKSNLKTNGCTGTDCSSPITLSSPLASLQISTLKTNTKNKEISKNNNSLRRSPRFLARKNLNSKTNSGTGTDCSSPINLSSTLASLQISTVKSNTKNEETTKLNLNDNAQCDDIAEQEQELEQEEGEEQEEQQDGDDTFFNLSINWDSTAIPLQSSLIINNKHKSRIKSKKVKNEKMNNSVNWGNIELRNYEQRCGFESCGVPSSNGPSLFIGKLLSQQKISIDTFEENKIIKKNNFDYKIYDDHGALKKKIRIQRVQMFSPRDLEKNNLKRDRKELKLLQKSRNNELGCTCLSIYKMKKDQLINRIIFLQRKTFDNNLNKRDAKKQTKEDKTKFGKLKKVNLLQKIKEIQFVIYGRYDVCCIDEECFCFKNGVQCNLEGGCCSCGGDIIYKNYLIDINKNKNIQKKQEAEPEPEMELTKNKKINKKKNKKNKKVNKCNSLSCGNKFGNSLHLNVLDYIYNNKNNKNNKNNDDNEEDLENEIVAEFDGMIEFSSPFVQKKILPAWNKHYDDNVGTNKEKKLKRKISFADENHE